MGPMTKQGSKGCETSTLRGSSAHVETQSDATVSCSLFSILVVLLDARCTNVPTGFDLCQQGTSIVVSFALVLSA
jgi:hypothetical protein